MGGGGSKPHGGLDEDDDTFLTMLDNDVLVALLGENEDLKAFSSRFTPSSKMDLSPNMAMKVVLSGEVAVYLIHNEARLHVKTYCKGEILPFFLHGEAYHPTSISDDASTIYLSPTLKLLFDLKIAAPVRQRRGTNQSSPGQSMSSRSEQRIKNNSHNRTLFSGKLAGLQRPELDAFLAERPHLTALHKLCSLKLAPMLMQSHEMLITEKLYADILCPLVSLRMLLEGDLLCYPDTAAVALNLHSQHQEHDYAKQAGVLLLGSLAAFNDSSDVAEVLERLDEQHRQRGTYRGANRARRTLLGNTFSGKVQAEVDWNQQGRNISPGSVVGVQNTFLHPKRTFDAVFASSHSIMGFVSPLTVEALRKVNASLISMWKVSYCSTFLAEVKASGKPILKGIADFGIQFLAARTTLQTVMKGDVVFKEGAAPDTFYFIIDGEFEERIAGREKSRVLLTGGHYGASSIIAKIPYKGSLVALSKATLMAIPAAIFIQIISQDPKVVIEIKLRAAGLDTDLIHVLKHATGYGEFRSYLQASFCAENINFWKAVDEWDDACEDFRASSVDPALQSKDSAADAGPTSATAAANTSSSAAAATSLDPSRTSSFDSPHTGSDDGKPSSRPPSSHSSHSHSYSSRPGAGSISVNGVRRDSLEKLPPLHILHWPKLSALRQRCRRTIDQFCTMNSDESVNIPHVLRVAIEKQFKAWSEWEAKEGEAAAAASAASGNGLALVSAPFDLSLLHIFHAAQREVYELMRKDPFSRYKNTPAFTNFIRSLAEENASESRRRRGEDVERLRAYMSSFLRESPVGAMSVMRA